MEIRDSQLHRETHATFESYCQERWGWSRQRSYQLIDAATVTTMVDRAGLPAPANERQARELVPLLREEQELVEAYREALDDGERVTAADIRRQVRKRKERASRESDLAERRLKLEAEARTERERREAQGEQPFRLEVANVRTWAPGPVDAIITDPPYVTDDALELYSNLADFAVRELVDGGVLAAMVWPPMLEAVTHALARPELAFRWSIVWRFATHANTVDHHRHVFDRHKLVLVYHRGAMPIKAPYFDDVVESPAATKDLHAWQQSAEGFERLVCSPGFGIRQRLAAGSPRMSLPDYGEALPRAT
jgi:hypothetical protein